METTDPRWARRPHQIRLLSRTFSIEWMPGRFIAADGVACFGECEYETQVVRVASSVPAETIAEILIHELGHAMSHMCDADEPRSEEDAVNLGAMVIITVAKANPGFLSWIDDMSQ